MTDHCVISISFQLGIFKPMSDSLWKFNNSRLDHEDFCNETKILLKEIDELEMSSLCKCEWFQFKMREIAIRTRKYISKAKKQKQQDY